MASFTDNIPVFNPYVQQLPVEEMVKVGMEKQRRYDEGVQKIQQTIDQVAGLNIYRDEDKQHLQSKLNELGSKLRTVAAGDFSNNQLVNSVAGMATKVAKDPIVLAAVQSTAVIQDNQKIMEEAREKGTLTPQNEMYYNKRLQSYIISGLTDDEGRPIKFNSKYVPYFDNFKFARETFDAIKPDNMTWDQVYETDTDGNVKIDPRTKEPILSPVMIRMEQEGRFPQKVKDTIDQIFSDPRFKQQLQIDGEYNYQGYTPDILKNRIISQNDTVEKMSNDLISNLTLQKSTTNVEEEKNYIDDQIKAIENSMSNNKEQYLKLLEMADSNPDSVRGLLYADEVMNKYTSMFSQMSTKKTTMTNPGWQAKFQEDKERFDRYKWQTDHNYIVQRDAIKDSQFEREFNLKLLKESADKSKGSGALLDTQGLEVDNMPAEYNEVMDFNDQFSRSLESYQKASIDLLWETTYKNINNNQQRYDSLILRNTPEQAKLIILQEQAKKEGYNDFSSFTAAKELTAIESINRKGFSIVPPDVADLLTSYNVSRKNYLDNKLIKDQVDKETTEKIGNTVQDLLQSDEIKPTTIKFRGKDVTLSKQNIIDLGVYMNGYKHVWGFAIDDGARNAAKAAEQNLIDDNKKEILDYMMRTSMYEPVSLIARVVKQPFETIADDFTRLTGSTKVDLSQVQKVYEKVNNEKFAETLKVQGEILKMNGVTSPRLKGSIFTGKAETDNRTLSDIKRIASGYSSIGNLSPDFESFVSNISSVTNPKDVTLEIKTRNVGGVPRGEIVLFKDGKRIGGMVAQEDELKPIIDLQKIYTPDNIKALENRINVNAGRTSNDDPNNPQTYLRSDAYFQKSSNDFPSLSAIDNYDVMANIVKMNDKYYGKIFIRDVKNGRNLPIQTTGGYDLPTLYSTLNSLSPAYLNSVITNNPLTK